MSNAGSPELVLLLAAGLTVIIELAFFWLVGYRNQRFLLVCILINIATNLTLNLGLSLASQWYPKVIYPAEVAVVVVEWAVLRLVANKGQPVGLWSRASAKLLVFVFLANLASFLIGLALWH